MPPSPSSESRLPCWTLAALPLLVAAWLRFRGLGALEPFVDEGANILTSLDPRVAAAFEPLEQGRPLLRQLFALTDFFPEHALLAARAMTALTGLTTMTALAWILHRLAGRAAALCGLWLWAALPFAVFHERMALQDPFGTALLALALACTVVPRVSPLATGALLGLAFLNKISAVFALPWLGLVYVAVQKHNGRAVFDRRLLLLAGSAAAAVGLYLRSDLFALGSHLARYNALPGSGSEATTYGSRLLAWLAWYRSYGGWPLGLLLAAALAIQLWRPSRLAPLAGAAWLTTLLVDAAFYNHTLARYLHPDHLPLVLFLALSFGAAWDATNRTTRMAVHVSFVAALIGWLNVSRQIASDPASAPLPPAEITQYVTGPWSGRGLNDVRRFLDGYADTHNVRCLVLTHRFLRPGCYGLMLAELGDPRLGVVPFTVYEPGELAAALPGLKKISTGQRVAFFLLYEGSLYPAAAWLDKPSAPTRRVFTTPHGATEKFTLFQFEP